MSRILLAEDDRISRVMLQAVLLKWGHQVVTAVDGREALQCLLDPNGPSIAILDWMMPGLIGPDVCRMVRKTPGLRPIHIILLTVKSKGSEAAEALGSGADDHLAKPYDIVELQARIQLGVRHLEQLDSDGSRLGPGQDQLLQNILARFLPLNDMALRALLEDPSRLGVPTIIPGHCDLACEVPKIVSESAKFLLDHVKVSVSGKALEAGVSAQTVRQIVLNVLAHVRMASNDRPCRVDIFWREREDGILLCCEDDGPEVLPEDVTLLGWPATTLRNQGMNPGFGLFFANLAAQAAGGFIACSTPAGRGLRTEIRLPRA